MKEVPLHMESLELEAAEKPRREELVERLFQATLGSFDLLPVYLGERLGLYRTLADQAGMTPRELAAATGTNER